MSGSNRKFFSKRNVIGSKVCAQGYDNIFYPGTIIDVQCLHDQFRYKVKFDQETYGRAKPPICPNWYFEGNLIGPGFDSLGPGTELKQGQRVYLTHNGREFSAEIVDGDNHSGMWTVSLCGELLSKRIDDLRLLPSRKSARLACSNLDFAVLADVAVSSSRKAVKRKAVDSTITINNNHSEATTREPQPETTEGVIDRNTAALIMISIAQSCQPINKSNQQTQSPAITNFDYQCDTDSMTCYSPTFSEGEISNNSEESENDKIFNATVYQCALKGPNSRMCGKIAPEYDDIVSHVRTHHADEILGVVGTKKYSPPSSPQPTDHEYSKTTTAKKFRLSDVGRETFVLRSTPKFPLKIADLSGDFTREYGKSIPPNVKEIDTVSILLDEPKRQVQKCRRVYGVHLKAKMWCTQCKWKKACSRFPRSSPKVKREEIDRKKIESSHQVIIMQQDATRGIFRPHIEN